jgi:uncharacterized membrane protein
LLVYSFFRRGPGAWIGATAGGVLLTHGLKSHSPLYEVLGVTGRDATTTSHPLSRDVHSRSSATIDAPAEKLYKEWRDVPQLTRFFQHVEQIEPISDTRSRWTARLPTDRDFTWEAIINEQRENERFSWHATEDSPIDHRGTISFQNAPGGRGTVVTLELQTHLPGGALGALLGKAMGRDPSWEAAEALRRFKQWIETGGIVSARSPSARKDGWTGHSLREEAFGGSRPRANERTLEPPQPAQVSDEHVEEASRESFPASDAPGYNA